MAVRDTLARAALALLALALLFQPLSAAAQLPPDVQIDRLWLRAERQIGNGEYWLALASLNEILELQTQHELAIPDAFWFSHAAASHEAGLHEQAVASATRYVESTGREGEHYLAALELLDAAETAAEREAVEARRLWAERERAEARRAARQAVIDAQAQAAAAVGEEMAKVAAELVRLAPGMEVVVIPTRLAFTTCTATCGSGFRTAGMRATTVRRRMGSAWQAGDLFPFAWSAAVPCATIRVTFAPRSATRTPPVTAASTSSSVFV